ncbi:MAG: general secretion pathway protein GspB, partial [Planctomycetota bacterium]
RRVLPYFVTGALLLNAVVLVIWMRGGQTLLKWYSPTVTEKVDQLAPQAIIPGNTISPDSSVTASVTVKTPTPEVVEEIDNKASMNESFVELKSAIPTGINETTADLLSEPEIAQPKPISKTAVGDPDGWERIEPDTLSNKALSGQGDEPVRNLPDPGVMTVVSRLSGLPGAVRKDLPTVVFSGHLYSSNPDSSVVFVDNGRPVKKGRLIMDELYLHEITPTGVIVEFRGYLIEVGVLQNWTLN